MIRRMLTLAGAAASALLLLSGSAKAAAQVVYSTQGSLFTGTTPSFATSTSIVGSGGNGTLTFTGVSSTGYLPNPGPGTSNDSYGTFSFSGSATASDFTGDKFTLEILETVPTSNNETIGTETLTGTLQTIGGDLSTLYLVFANGTTVTDGPGGVGGAVKYTVTTDSVISGSPALAIAPFNTAGTTSVEGTVSTPSPNIAGSSFVLLLLAGGWKVRRMKAKNLVV